MRQLAAEALGTFTLVFFGTGSIIIDEQTHLVGNLGIAITFGVVVMIMIYVFGNTSGAHFNPAITIGFACASLFKPKKITGYLVAQLVGALGASLLLHILFPLNASLGSTLPATELPLVFVLEFILTFLLMFTILYTSQGSKLLKPYAGIAIGSVVFLEAVFAGPLTGASMNPARSLAPAVISGNVSTVWIYLVATTLGSITASLIWKKFRRQL